MKAELLYIRTLTKPRAAPKVRHARYSNRHANSPSAMCKSSQL